MTPGPPPHRGPWSAWPLPRASLAVVLFLATLGSFGASFGVMTGCTNDYSCTSVGCAPCDTTSGWLTVGWVGQGVLLLVGVVLTVLAARGVRIREVRFAALVLGPLSFALFAVTTAVAISSY